LEQIGLIRLHNKNSGPEDIVKKPLGYDKLRGEIDLVDGAAGTF
jgi:hypothetical protein